MKTDVFLERNRESPFLKELHFKRELGDEGANNYDVSISFSTFPSYESIGKLEVKFVNVGNIKIDNINGLHQFLVSIEDISMDQVEGFKYRVTDIAGGNISFLCDDFEILD